MHVAHQNNRYAYRQPFNEPLSHPSIFMNICVLTLGRNSFTSCLTRSVCLICVFFFSFFIFFTRFKCFGKFCVFYVPQKIFFFILFFILWFFFFLLSFGCLSIVINNIYFYGNLYLIISIK